MTGLAHPRRGRGRPPSIDSERLLEVARAVFLEQGIRATALEVAQRAGVSEGAVFHRFKTKEALFRAAMRFDEDDVKVLLVSVLRDVQKLELREGLIVLGTMLIEVVNVALPLTMMSWSNPERSPQDHYEHLKRRSQDSELRAEFTKFCAAQVEAGRLRPVDPEVFAIVFLGSIYQFCMHRLLSGDRSIPEGMYVRGLVDIVLGGVLPPAHPPARPSGRRAR